MGKRFIRWLVMDVDGTLTDGKIYMGPNGEAMKAFDVKDGYAIANMLPMMGIEPVVITGRKSEIVSRRCEELGVTRLYQGVSDKLAVLEKMLEEKRSTLSEVAFMGDDLNDLECMEAVNAAGGLSACPADAASEVRAISDYIAKKVGGSGAVRDLVELFSHNAGGADLL